MHFADACDAVEQDLKKMLWSQMNMYKMFVYNRDKYIFVQALLPPDVFDAIVVKIKELANDLEDYMDEIHSHRDLLVVKIKTYVDERTQMIVDYAVQTKKISPPQTQTMDLEIVRTISHPGPKLARENLPEVITEDTRTWDVFDGTHPTEHLREAIENMKEHNLHDMFEDQTRVYGGDGESTGFVVNKIPHLQEIEALPMRRKLGRRNVRNRVKGQKVGF